METAELVTRIMRAKYEQLCPECGAKMTETDRAVESGITFIWYRCSRNDCSGQWLQKKPAQSDVAVGLAYAH
jgi:hypothetical protein